MRKSLILVVCFLFFTKVFAIEKEQLQVARGLNFRFQFLIESHNRLELKELVLESHRYFKDIKAEELSGYEETRALMANFVHAILSLKESCPFKGVDEDQYTSNEWGKISPFILPIFEQLKDISNENLLYDLIFKVMNSSNDQERYKKFKEERIFLLAKDNFYRTHHIYSGLTKDFFQELKKTCKENSNCDTSLIDHWSKAGGAKALESYTSIVNTNECWNVGKIDEERCAEIFLVPAYGFDGLESDMRYGLDDINNNIKNVLEAGEVHEEKFQEHSLISRLRLKKFALYERIFPEIFAMIKKLSSLKDVEELKELYVSEEHFLKTYELDLERFKSDLEVEAKKQLSKGVKKIFTTMSANRLVSELMNIKKTEFREDYGENIHSYCKIIKDAGLDPLKKNNEIKLSNGDELDLINTSLILKSSSHEKDVHKNTLYYPFYESSMLANNLTEIDLEQAIELNNEIVNLLAKIDYDFLPKSIAFVRSVLLSEIDSYQAKLDKFKDILGTEAYLSLWEEVLSSELSIEEKSTIIALSFYLDRESIDGLSKVITSNVEKYKEEVLRIFLKEVDFPCRVGAPRETLFPCKLDKLKNNGSPFLVGVNKDKKLLDKIISEQIPTKEEINAVKEYTNDSYLTLNRDLREENSKGNSYKLADIVDKGLEKNYSYRGTVYRGSDFPLEIAYAIYKVGEITTEKQFLSTSRSKSMAAEWANGIFYEIECLNGCQVHDFSYYREEEEILLKSGAHYLVNALDTDKESGNLVINMTEVQASFEVCLEKDSNKIIEKEKECEGKKRKFSKAFNRNCALEKKEYYICY